MHFPITFPSDWLCHQLLDCCSKTLYGICNTHCSNPKYTTVAATHTRVAVTHNTLAATHTTVSATHYSRCCTNYRSCYEHYNSISTYCRSCFVYNIICYAHITTAVDAVACITLTYSTVETTPSATLFLIA